MENCEACQSMDLNKFPKVLKDELDTMDAFTWNQIFIKHFDKSTCIMESKTEDDKKGVQSTLKIHGVILDEYPVLMLEPALENLIEDTTPDLETLKIPYQGLFINKTFKYGNGVLKGIFVEDSYQFMIDQLIRKRGFSKEDATIYANTMNIMGQFRQAKMMFSTIYVEGDTASLILSDVRQVTEYLNKMPKAVGKLAQRTMFYAANVAQLITSHVNLENPTDKTREYRVVPHYVTKKPRPYSIIRVFGDVRKYAQDYNKERRKIKTSDKAVIVRGFWRHYKHERYTNMRGQIIWVPPFIRGMDKELHNRLIKLKP